MVEAFSFIATSSCRAANISKQCFRPGDLRHTKQYSHALICSDFATECKTILVKCIRGLAVVSLRATVQVQRPFASICHSYETAYDSLVDAAGHCLDECGWLKC